MARTFQPPPTYQRRTYTPPSYLQPTTPTSPAVLAATTGERREPREPIAPIVPSYDHVPIRRHTRLDLMTLLRDRICPPTPPSFPDLEEMRWRFDDFADYDDNEVRLYLYLSPEDIAKAKYFGIEHEVFEKEPIADELMMARIEEEMASELASTFNPHLKAAIQMEHDEYRSWLQNTQIGLTVAHYRAFPFRRAFTDRLQAIGGIQKLNKIMNDLQGKFERIKK